MFGAYSASSTGPEFASLVYASTARVCVLREALRVFGLSRHLRVDSVCITAGVNDIFQVPHPTLNSSRCGWNDDHMYLMW